MPRSGRPKAGLAWSAQERAAALALRSKIVLACAEATDNTAVAAQLGCNQVTVGKWWSRFVEHRLDGLTDEARPGRPASITIEQIEDVGVATLESTPKNATHWSKAKLAQRTGLSKLTIGRIWNAYELRPHQVDGFKLSNDPLPIETVQAGCRRSGPTTTHGTTSLFAALNVADGSVISPLHRRHRAIEFKKFLTKIDAQVPRVL